MKVVIFAGGLGSRISEESHLKPKPMIEIGGKPILWHIMKIYQSHGYTDFIVCLGYKGYIIKEYFANYFLHNADVTFDLANNQMEIHKANAENLKVTLVDTGLNTMTAGRLQKVKSYLEGEEEFMLTYGDGVSNVDITALVNFHRQHGKIATVTAIQPAGKFGVLETNSNEEVTGFVEKPNSGGAWINGGFFVLKSDVFKYLEGNMEDEMWEQKPMKGLTQDQELVAYHHHGFWKCMDILRDKVELEKMWITNPQWKKWN
ncbi:glucose-1-phosphate cytidylyltransferase [Flammeovirga yaeyamensis]|uniref:Glucose-1-phosphate cytidylyltransferase n=1 Tax=Flammeovirga yaeyamensis TaxID=367791 RepID=A0AAX1MXW3_9BACT|nr:glucose-1-phosphate cytidylyltransferase [Flammeovirga yaeyamensis]MBB3696331.1 glucose-1-phosphate cytidylyltransferase [Flammeovirga yaeyamensis]NMF35010.1 glucose-1-phosphate cytidylyltransferase [Flammeovirga yaeyamensis]QWG00163.1 glucose-1-phosphate cytidylyltransferase [Flammeovirga yaeyamensis]